MIEHPGGGPGSSGHRSVATTYRHAHRAGIDLSVRALLDSLAGIQETVLLYQAQRGRPRARRMITDLDPTQKKLYEVFDLDRYAPRR
jgi:phosphatidylserine/phosphatidylglycerophosphate/cardiolipin synthase-like enzyme